MGRAGEWEAGKQLGRVARDAAGGTVPLGATLRKSNGRAPLASKERMQ